MGKDIEPLLAKVVERIKEQQAEIDALKEKIGQTTEAYMEGVKDGIAYMQKHK